MDGGDPKYRLQDITINQVDPAQSITKAHLTSIQTVAAHPDSSHFVTGSHDKTIKVWDVKKTKELMTLADHKEGVWSLEYSKDGSKLLSASADTSVLLWDSKKGQPGLRFNGHKDKVYSARFNETSTLVASCGDSSQLMIWDMAKGDKPLKQITLDAKIGYDITWSNDGSVFFVTTFGSKLFAYDSKTFELLDQDCLNQDPESRCENCAANFETIPGRLFCATDRGNIAWYEYDSKARKMKKETEFLAHMDPCRCTVLHPQRKVLFSSGKDGSARLWDCSVDCHPVIMANLVLHNQNVTQGAFLGKSHLITASWDSNVGIWNTEAILK